MCSCITNADKYLYTHCFICFSPAPCVKKRQYALFNSIQFNSLFQTKVHTHVHNNIIQNKIQCLLTIKY